MPKPLALVLMVLLLLMAAGPTIVSLVHALVPLVLVGGLVAAVLRVIWRRTGGW